MEWAVYVSALVLGGYGLHTINTYIRAKHGYPIENDDGKLAHPIAPPADARKIELLTAENDRLKGALLRLEERVAVLERIATDPGARVAREIDSLA